MKPSPSFQGLLRVLPSVNEIDQALSRAGLPTGKSARREVNQLLERLRTRIVESEGTPDPEWSHIIASRQNVLEYLVGEVRHRLRQQRTQRVINGTGVVIHTNLGRSPLGKESWDSIIDLVTGYSTLEFDLSTGGRGQRHQGLLAKLSTLAEVESTLVVNNNAAGVFLTLKALTAGREVIVSRGELVEIGGSFRIPDIMREAGAILVEVGTTNRTRLSDYKEAINANTAAVMKVHPSNYSIEGFHEEVRLDALSELARSHQLLCLHDWGSGSFHSFSQPVLHQLPTAQQITGLADVTLFSADKLLGSIQAGLILGRKTALEAIRRSPLYRCVRLDKLTAAVLEANLDAYLTHNTDSLPTLAMLEKSQPHLKAQAEAWLATLSELSQIKVEATALESVSGGGANPATRLPSFGVHLSWREWKETDWQHWFLQQTPPVIGRIADGRFLIDFRCLLPGEPEQIRKQLVDLESELSTPQA